MEYRTGYNSWITHFEMDEELPLIPSSVCGVIFMKTPDGTRCLEEREFNRAYRTFANKSRRFKRGKELEKEFNQQL